jgi:predicted phage terminase large subunit-like protein
MNARQAAATVDPAAFATYVSNGTWTPAAHLEHIIDKLRAVAAGELSRLLVFAPPRHGKSELLKHYAAWFLGRFPDKTVAVASYNDELAADFGRAVRAILNAHGKELFGVTIATDSSAAYRFSIADHDGGMYAVGVGGSMTGRGADLLILDDVVKSDVEALSETTQRRHWDWWRSTAMTRLEPGAAIVGIGTRWSVGDLLGRLADSGSFDVVRLPALAEDDDLLGREPGEALWPARYSTETLESIKAEQGGFWWASMYQGTPEPMSGNLFPRDLFREFTETTETYQLDGKTIPKVDCSRFAIADTALSDKRTADYTVIGMFDLTPDKDLLWLERWRGRYSGPDQVKLMRKVFDEWHPAWIGIEAATPGLHLLQQLESSLPVKKLKPIGSKIARATTAATFLEQGKIWFPRKRWLDELYTELVTFPHAKHDDQVDVLAYAAQQIAAKKRVRLTGWTLDPALYKDAGMRFGG